MDIDLSAAEEEEYSGACMTIHHSPRKPNFAWIGTVVAKDFDSVAAVAEEGCSGAYMTIHHSPCKPNSA